MSDPHKSRSPYQRPPRPRALFDAFLGKRTAPADDPLEWTAESTLWSHYLRWAFLQDLRPSPSQVRLSRWLTKKEIQTTVVNGFTLWALRLTDDREEVAKYEDRDRLKSKVVMSRVRITRRLDFYERGKDYNDKGSWIALEPGTVVDRMTPSKLEEADLRELYRRQIENQVPTPTTWLVIMWRGMRRLVAARDIAEIAHGEEQSVENRVDK